MKQCWRSPPVLSLIAVCSCVKKANVGTKGVIEQFSLVTFVSVINFSNMLQSSSFFYRCGKEAIAWPKAAMKQQS